MSKRARIKRLREQAEEQGPVEPVEMQPHVRKRRGLMQKYLCAPGAPLWSKRMRTNVKRTSRFGRR